MPDPAIRLRHVGADRAEEFVRLGHARRYFFPHRVCYLPKCGPDGFKLATRMCGPSRIEELWEVLVYADASLLTRFPAELFFDDELVWHQQQFGRPGLVATANLVLRGPDLYSNVHQSDLVQRASRVPAHRTQLQKVFKGWPYMILNAILNFAIERQVRFVHVPTASLALRHTDPARSIGGALFERVYDEYLQRFCRADRSGEWWRVPVDANRDRVLGPRVQVEGIDGTKTISVCHDIEGGFGHRDVDAALARRADDAMGDRLARMLEIEDVLGVAATYNVVGALFDRLRDTIASHRHCLAFHSFDHRSDDETSQIPRCRQVDYRIKGYRPPRSILTPELTDENLCFHNFEWLASSAYSFGTRTPSFGRGLARIPIAFDDFAMYHDGLAYDVWERQALAALEGEESVAFCLHDCYADRWLPHYAGLLKKVRNLGRLRTVDQVAAELILGSAA